MKSTIPLEFEHDFEIDFKYKKNPLKNNINTEMMKYRNCYSTSNP